MKSNTDYESLDSYFRNLRDKIEIAEKDYPVLKGVINGESNLAEIVNGYENRFYALITKRSVLLDKLGIRKLQDNVLAYASELEQFAGMMQEVSGREINYSSYFSKTGSACEEYIRESSVFIDKVKYGSVTAGGVGSIILACVIPFLFPPTIIPVLLLLGGLTGGSIATGAGIVKLDELPSGYSRYTLRDIKYFFESLSKHATVLEKDIHTAYAVEHFTKNQEIFKKTYLGADTGVRDYIKTKLTAMQDLGLLDMSASKLESLLKYIEQDNLENQD